MKYYAVERTGPYLAHHGILGQKWGVRRFQNKDGSLTSAGKKRYRDMSMDDFDKEVYDYMNERSHKGLIRSSFEKARDQVLARCSNEIGPLKKEGLHMSEVSERGRLDPTETKQCIRLAVRRYNYETKVEPAITRDVIDAVSSVGAKMYGLEYRLKRPASLAAKIGADAKENGQSFENTARKIRDGIRYTAILDDKSFVDNYYQIKRELDKRGYYETDCKNYFDRYRLGYSKHKAIQSTFIAPPWNDTNKNFDNKFELQFHTASSQAAKELKLPLYNERRKAGISPKRARQLERKMTNLAEKVSDPWGVYEIEEHMS